MKLNEEEIEIAACTVTKVAAQLNKIKLNKQRAREYGLNLGKSIAYKKTIPALSIVYGLNNLESKRPYNSAEFQKEINRELNIDALSDSTDLLSDSYQETIKYIVSSKDMNKAIKALEREIGLIHIMSKKTAKEIVKGKYVIRLDGRPSFFMLPSNSDSLKKIMYNPEAIRVVFNSLKRMGLIDHLEFLYEAYLYLLRDHDRKYTDSIRDITNLSRKFVTNDPSDMTSSTLQDVSNPELESAVQFLRLLDEDQIKLIAKKIIELIQQEPQFARVILLFALKAE